MSKQQPPANSNLEQILADLEQKFGASSSEEKPTQKSYKKKTVAKLSKQTLLSLVALVVIVVGAAASYFLVPQSQEIRQQALEPYQQNCVSGESSCLGKNPGAACNTSAGDPGNCVAETPSASTPCSCNPSGGEPLCTGGVCVEPSMGCSPGWVLRGNQQECDLMGGYACCPVGTGPTRTPTPRPTNTPVIVQPTNTPGSGGGPSPVPTQSPANTPRPTNTPTRVPTATPTRTPTIPPAAQCVSITMGTQPDRGNNPPLIGDTVGFQCAEISGATNYQFRIRIPSGQILDITSSVAGSRISQPYVIQNSGSFKAQCRGCVGTTCQEWEAL